MEKINIYVVVDTKEKKMQVYNILKDYKEDYKYLLNCAKQHPNRYMEIRYTRRENGLSDIGNLSLGGTYKNNKAFDSPKEIEIKELLNILRKIKNEL